MNSKVPANSLSNKELEVKTLDKGVSEDENFPDDNPVNAFVNKGPSGGRKGEIRCKPRCCSTHLTSHCE